MPPGNKPQSNAMLYTLITFVGLFIAATTFAIIYYVKAEKHRTNAVSLENQIDQLATSAERQKIGTLIGAEQRRKSRLGTMVDYLDTTVSLIIGGLPEETSAEVKVDKANRKAKDALLSAQEHIDVETIDPNTVGLIPLTEKLKTKLDNLTNAQLALEEQLEGLQNRFDDAMTASSEKEQTLLAEKEKYQKQVDDIKQDYDELEALLEQTSEQRVQTLMTQLNEEKDKYEKEHQELLKTQAELKVAQDRLKRFQDELFPPDPEVAAYEPDGKIISIDDRTKIVIVHLNIGSDDHVYPGLTFSVYDRSMPIPRDGKGKAEIKVFNVGKNVSQARVTLSEPKRPIVLDDIVANLVWDSEKTNIFAVAGEFDLDDDGAIDYDAVDKIRVLIEKWGGRLADTVSVNTDFLVLGKAPKIRRKPTLDEMELDPMAMEKYEASLQKLADYNEIKSAAQTLWIPVFNYERFLYLIGYKAQSGRPGGF